MKNDFTQSDLTAIHTRLMLESKGELDLAADRFKATKARAKDEGVDWKLIKQTLDFLNESDAERDLRAKAIERAAEALGFKTQLSFDFIRVSDDWDRLLGQGRMAAILNRPCEPPNDLKGVQREKWIEGWTNFMKVFDAYQDVLDEQADKDRKAAQEAVNSVFTQENLDKITDEINAKDKSGSRVTATLVKVA